LRQQRGEKTSGIIDLAFDSLIKVIQEAIQDLNIGNEEADEDQEWGSSVAAGCCLSLISQVVGDRVVSPITLFAADNITNESSWQKRYCGVVALGAILEGPTKENLHQILPDAIPLLMKLIDDRHQRVRYAV